MITRNRMYEMLEDVFQLCAFDDDTPPDDLQENLKDARQRIAYILYKNGYGDYENACRKQSWCVNGGLEQKVYEYAHGADRWSPK